MRTLFVVTLVVILSACGATPKKPPPVHPKFKFETRSYISDYCLLSDDKPRGLVSAGAAAVIASIVAPAIAEYAITAIAKNLQEIEHEETIAKSDFYLYQYKLSDPKAEDLSKRQYPQFNGYFKCVTTVTGNFLTEEKKQARAGGIVTQWKSAEQAIAFEQNNAEQQILERLTANNIYLNGESEGLFSIYEAKIDFARDESAIRLENRYLHVRTLLKNKKKVGMAYTFTIKGPGSSPNSKNYATIPVDFGEVSPGTILHGDKFKVKRTGWVIKPGMTAASLSYFFKHHYGTLTTCKVPVAMCAPIEYMPVQLIVTNTQTKKPGEVSKFLGKILESSKESLVESFKGEFFPDEDAISAAQADATIAVLTAVAAIEDAGPSETKKALANAQLVKACNALKAAGGHNDKCK